MRYFCKSCGNAFEAEPAGQTVYCSRCGAPQPAHSSATRKKPIIWLALIAVPVILFLIGGTVIVFKLLPTLLTGNGLNGGQEKALSLEQLYQKAFDEHYSKEASIQEWTKFAEISGQQWNEETLDELVACYDRFIKGYGQEFQNFNNILDRLDEKAQTETAAEDEGLYAALQSYVSQLDKVLTATKEARKKLIEYKQSMQGMAILEQNGYSDNLGWGPPPTINSSRNITAYARRPHLLWILSRCPIKISGKPIRPIPHDAGETGGYGNGRRAGPRLPPLRVDSAGKIPYDRR